MIRHAFRLAARLCSAALGLVFLASVSAAQSVAERRLGRAEEYVGGAAANLLLRGPWTAPGWRRPLPRVAIFLVSSTIWERVLDGSHGGRWTVQAWRDWRERAVGYAVLEAVVALWRLRGSPHPAP